MSLFKLGRGRIRFTGQDGTVIDADCESMSMEIHEEILRHESQFGSNEVSMGVTNIEATFSLTEVEITPPEKPGPVSEDVEELVRVIRFRRKDVHKTD